MTEQDLIKLAVSAVLGILLGVERELKRKPLGLKTCLVISVTSCLLTIVSIDTAYVANQVGGIVRADPMRLAAQIVSGIGFLGAGVIMRKNNEVISGLTTAAIVWASSGLGIAVGAGFYVEAFVGLLLLIFAVELVPGVMKRLGPRVLREKEVEVNLTLVPDVDVDETLRSIDQLGCRVERVRTITSGKSERRIILIGVIDRDTQVPDLFHRVEQIKGVVHLGITAL